MELNVGDYVRTKEGNIFKIISGNEDNYEIDIDYSKLEQTEENWLELYRYNNNHSFFNDENIIKSSPNIIDLIEVGDYVNNFLVINKNKDSITIIELILPAELKEKDIKTVVTKEQFESVKYKLED